MTFFDEKKQLIPSDRYNFYPEFWDDKGDFLLSTAPQGTPEWRALRTLRLTASNLGYALGKNDRFNTPEDILLMIAGIKEKEFTEEAKKNMEHGTETEPEAREWYMKKYDCKVEEIGLAVGKGEVRFGASSDGDVIGTKGIIEIKCPQKMYQPLLDFKIQKRAIKNNNPSKKWPNKFYHKHIWETHYYQMQGTMSVLGKKWCDYIVYVKTIHLKMNSSDVVNNVNDVKELKIQVEVNRVYFNREEWDKITFPLLKSFLRKLDRLLRKKEKEEGRKIMQLL